MEANEGVRKFISWIKDIRDKLGDIGEIVDSVDLMIIVLKGLVLDYKAFISSLLAIAKALNFEELAGDLIQ